MTATLYGEGSDHGHAKLPAAVEPTERDRDDARAARFRAEAYPDPKERGEALVQQLNRELERHRALTDYDISFVMVDEPDAAFTLADFAANNADSPDCGDWCAELRALSIGSSLMIGGGAAPVSTIRRVT